MTSLKALGTTAERRVVCISPKTFLKAKRFCILSKKDCRLGLLPSSQYFLESPRNLRRCRVAPNKTSAKVKTHPQSQSSHFCPGEIEVGRVRRNPWVGTQRLAQKIHKGRSICIGPGVLFLSTLISQEIRSLLPGYVMEDMGGPQS